MVKEEKLDGLTFAQYSMGGAVDISAPIVGYLDQWLGSQVDTDPTTLTVKEWARRKNATFLLSSTAIAALGLNILMSRKSKRWGGHSTIEEIGHRMAASPRFFWGFWTTKMVTAGFVFSRIMPWARFMSHPKVRLRLAPVDELRPHD